MDELSDYTPPHGSWRLPTPEELPLEVHMLKVSVAALQQARSLDRKVAESQRKYLRNLWIAVLGLTVTMALTAAAALVQMGRYMERIDTVQQSQLRIERQLGLGVRRLGLP